MTLGWSLEGKLRESALRSSVQTNMYNKHGLALHKIGLRVTGQSIQNHERYIGICVPNRPSAKSSIFGHQECSTHPTRKRAAKTIQHMVSKKREAFKAHLQPWTAVPPCTTSELPFPPYRGPLMHPRLWPSHFLPLMLGYCSSCCCCGRRLWACSNGRIDFDFNVGSFFAARCLVARGSSRAGG